MLSIVKTIEKRAASIALMSAGLAMVASTAVGSAATATTQTAVGAGNGIKISPVRTEMTIEPGSSNVIDVYVSNVTALAAKYQVIANDFVASGDETGSPAVILNPNQSAPSHGLKQYISPMQNIEVAAQQTEDVKVIITIPKDAAPGGYYGAIRVAPATSGTPKGKNVSLSASVASLVLVKVPGNIKEQVTVASMDARVGDKSRSIFSSNKNISAIVRFQNEGNIQEQPFGKIQVKNDLTGKKDNYEINTTTPKGNVLPDSIRKFSIPLKNLSAFGRYTLTGNFGYGTSGQLISGSSTFYIIPLPIIIALLLLVVIIVVAIFEAPRAIKRYNKRVLRKAGRD